ncbi:MAG: helix-turn-helix transcriptional regulator [Nitrospirales bacterium]|nr:helix-turn-helix transcriptional regulator [Nitrospirales bacterium]
MRVRQLRLKKGWTQEQLAERAGHHWTYIGGIERGERNITLAVIADIAQALGVAIRDLFPKDGNHANPSTGARLERGCIRHSICYSERVSHDNRCQRQARRVLPAKGDPATKKEGACGRVCLDG